MDEIQIFTCEYVTSNIRSTTYQKFLEHDRVPLRSLNSYYHLYNVIILKQPDFFSMEDSDNQL